MIRVAAVIALLIASPAAAQDAPNILGADKLADRCFGNAVDQLMCESYVSGWLAGALSGQRGLVAEFCPTATSTGRDLIETFLTEVRKDETVAGRNRRKRPRLDRRQHVPLRQDPLTDRWRFPQR